MITASLNVARARAAFVYASVLALSLILLLIFLLYRPSLDDWFVQHDYIHINAIRSTGVGEYVKKVLDPGNGGESLFDTGKLYRPVYYLALLAEEKAFALEPFGYHLVNLSLHLLNVLLVWLIAGRLARSRIVPAVAALIYGIHPAYIDAVGWISAITEVLLATFSLAAIYLFMRSLEERGLLGGLFYGGSFLCAALALGAREPGVALPLILLAYYFLAHHPSAWRQPGAWLRFLPFFAVLAAWGLLRLSVAGSVLSGEGEAGVGRLGWHVFVNMWKFCGWAVVPVFNQVGPWVPVVEGFAAIALLRASEQVLRKGSGGARFAVVWFYLALIPYSTQETWLLAGRYMYAVMAAFAILCGMFVAWLAEEAWLAPLARLPRLPPLPWPAIGRAAAAGAVAVAAIVLSIGMLHRQDTFSEKGQESRAFLNQLQETYPTLPGGSTLYVVDPPQALLFADMPLFLEPAVRISYPGLADVRNLTGAQYQEIAPSLGENDFVLFYEP